MLLGKWEKFYNAHSFACGAALFISHRRLIAASSLHCKRGCKFRNQVRDHLHDVE